MSSKSKVQNSKRLKIVLFCSLFIVYCSVSCSFPNLEKTECREARQTIKEFYSFHFGNEMKFSPENLRQREKFLTADYAKTLQNAPPENDVFTTNSNDYPKAFRIGGCEADAVDKTVFDVLLFWKDDARTEQRAIKVELTKQNGAWLINKINY